MVMDWMLVDGEWKPFIYGFDDDWIFEAYPDWDWFL
jgi:hypothetical protein